MTLKLCKRRFQNFPILHAFVGRYSNTKMYFSKRFSKVSSDKIILCNNNDQTRSSDTLTSARPLGVIKTLDFRLGFQHPPRYPADINACKNMFESYIVSLQHYSILTKSIIKEHTVFTELSMLTIYPLPSYLAGLSIIPSYLEGLLLLEPPLGA